MDLFPNIRRSPGPATGGGRRSPVRALGLALAVALLAAMLTPLAGSSPAAANQEPVATDEATPTVQDDGGDVGVEETPVPDEPPATDQTPVVEETPVEETPDAELIATQEDPYTSGITLTPYLCTSDYDLDLQQLLANCSVDQDIVFDVYGGGVLQQTVQGGFAILNLPAGQYTIRQDVPSNYGHLLPFCGFAPTGELIEPILVVTYDGYYEFALGADQQVACYWFNVRSSNISASMLSRFCPFGFAADAGYADFAAACLQERDGVVFRAYAGGGLIHESQTSGSPSAVAWEDLPGSGFRFEMGALADYGQAAVFCNLTAPEGTQSGYHRVNNVGDDGSAFRFDTTLLPGETLACDWFHLPAPSMLNLYRYVCPVDPGFDYYAADTDALYARCPAYTGTEAVFDLVSQTTGETQTRHTESGGGSSVGAYWTSVPPGGVTVTEHPWDGYGTPRVFCAYAYQTGLEFFDVLVAGWDAGFTMPSELPVLCFWFDIPEPGDVAIHILERYCPEGFDAYNVDLEALRETCQGNTDVWFAVYNGFGSEYGHGETGGDGDIAFAQLPADLYNVVETTPEGYGAPVVFCNLTIATGEQSGYQPWSTSQSDGAYLISETFNSGDVLVCEWFDVPLDEAISAVKVGARTCPAGQDLDQLSLEELYDEVCLTPAAGISFALTGAATGVIGPTQTGDNGELIWYGPPVDLYTLTEEVPAGYGTPVVFCGIYRPDLDEALIYERYPVSADNGIEFNLGQDEHALCYWFNVPAAAEELGELTIFKRFCPAELGFDPYLADLDTLQDGCAGTEGPSIGFALSSETGGQFPTLYTGGSPDGSVHWVGVPGGQADVTELAYDDYGVPVVFCYVLADDLESLPVDVAGWTAGFAFPTGQEVACLWFNIRADDGNDGHSLTIAKYFCPEDGAVDYYAVDLASLHDVCERYEGDAVGFELYSHESGETATSFTGSGPNGTAYWEQVPAGQIDVTEHAQEDYGTPRVFCFALGVDDGEPIPVDVAGWTAGFMISSDRDVLCSWFNIPEREADGQIVIYAWTCPAGSGNDPSHASLSESCALVKRKIGFHLTDEAGGDARQRTDKLGRGVWVGVAAGEYGIQEEIPKGYGQPIVFCGLVQGEETWMPEPWPVADGAIAFAHEGDGWVFVCDWFNLPDESQLADDESAVAEVSTIAGLPGRDESFGRLFAA